MSCCSGQRNKKESTSGAETANAALKPKGREEYGLGLAVRYLIRGSSPETVGFVAVEAEDLNGPLDAEVMENTAHLQRQQVLLGTSQEKKCH